MQTNKYDIICGEGKHRSYTAAIAEIILLNKYGNQNDYFWRLPKYYNEYVNLIKLSGKLSKEVGKDKLAYFLYSNPSYTFEDDIGLIIFNLRKFKKEVEFSLYDLMTVYKNKFRPPQQTIVTQDKQTTAPKKNTTVLGFLGDI